MESDKEVFIVFSKSYWDEPPRMRHQLTNLLRAKGHKVYFFEKPVPLWKSSHVQSPISNTLELLQSKELISHQLRVFKFLRGLNAFYEKKQIKGRLNAISSWKSAIIINFNYDYYFLRDVFKTNKIFTIINDDFEAQARLGSGAHVRSVQAKTCSLSDRVLTVSYPLREQLNDYCKPELFFPWAQEEYVKPSDSDKKTVLIWAYIRKDFDFDLIENLLRNRSEYTVRFVGPADSEAKVKMDFLKKKYNNVQVLGPSNLEDVKIDDVFVSLIPYKPKIGYVKAITASNKTFQLSSKGVPIVTYNMENFIEAKGIFNAGSIDQTLSFIDFCFDSFWDLQDSLKVLTEENSSLDRYRLIMSAIK